MTRFKWRHAFVKVGCAATLLPILMSYSRGAEIAGVDAAPGKARKRHGTACPPSLGYCREQIRRKAARLEELNAEAIEQAETRKIAKDAAIQRIMDEVSAKQRYRDQEAARSVERKERIKQLHKQQRDSGWSAEVNQELEDVAAAEKLYREGLRAHPVVPPREAFSMDRVKNKSLREQRAMARTQKALALAKELEALPPAGPRRRHWEEGGGPSTSDSGGESNYLKPLSPLEMLEPSSLASDLLWAQPPAFAKQKSQLPLRRRNRQLLVVAKSTCPPQLEICMEAALRKKELARAKGRSSIDTKAVEKLTEQNALDKVSFSMYILNFGWVDSLGRVCSLCISNSFEMTHSILTPSSPERWSGISRGHSWWRHEKR